MDSSFLHAYLRLLLTRPLYLLLFSVKLGKLIGDEIFAAVDKFLRLIFSHFAHNTASPLYLVLPHRSPLYVPPRILADSYSTEYFSTKQTSFPQLSLSYPQKRPLSHHKLEFLFS